MLAVRRSRRRLRVVGDVGDEYEYVGQWRGEGRGESRATVM